MTFAHTKIMKRKYLILIPIIILYIISIIYLPNNLKTKQIIWCFLSLIICLIISKIKLKKILKYSLLYYLLSIFLLILVLILNIFINGSRGWIKFGIISFQPSELAKIALILFTIKYYNKLNIWKLLVIYLMPMILIFLEPDTGAIIIEGIIFLYFLLRKTNKQQIKKLIVLFFITILFVFGIYILNKDFLIKILGPSIFYRFDRITNFLQDDSIQTTNALISIATGKLLYFPEMFNDFFIAYILSKNIFQIIPIIISTIFILILLKRKNTTISQVAFYIIFFQCYWNLAMNLKLVPVIGIPYLFLSYGGSHIITTMILIGLTINENSKFNNMDNSMV